MSNIPIQYYVNTNSNAIANANINMHMPMVESSYGAVLPKIHSNGAF